MRESKRIANHSWILLAIIVLTMLISGCAGQESGISPAELFKTDEVSWYEYQVIEDYSWPNQTHTGESKTVRVESFEETYEGGPALHKIIIATSARGNILALYDIYTDDNGRVLSGNYTIAGDELLHGIDSGVAYAQVTGFMDIAALLNAEKGRAQNTGNYETIGYLREAYNCTAYNLSAGNTTYTILYNKSLPLPVRINARLQSEDHEENRTFQLRSWGYSASTSATEPAPMAVAGNADTGTKLNDSSNGTTTRFEPSRLFRMDGLSWYSCSVQLQKKDTVEYYKQVVEYANETHHTGIRVKHTSIIQLWLHKDLVTGFDIWDKSSDGTAVDSRLRGLYNGTPHALAPGASGAASSRMYDVSTMFDAGKDSTLVVVGFEPIRHGDQVYNCTVYGLPGGNATYRIWHNESLPMPLRIAINDQYPGDFPDGLWTYDLEDWGYGPDTYDYERASQDGEKTGSLHEPSALFDMRNVSRYQYIVALQLSDQPKLVKLDIGYEYPKDMESKFTLVNKAWLYEDNSDNFRLEENRGNGTLLGGNITGGVTYGQPYAGRELYTVLLEDYKKADISARFDAYMDSTLKPAGYETIRYKGDLYNCTLYEVTVDNDSFRVWHNASQPLPLKIVAAYEKPGALFWHPGFGIVSGPCTYELVDWG